jgi:hypothetical protein
VRKPTTLGKAYGIMCGVIGNLGNPLGILWKHIGNKKIIKKSLPSPPQPARKKIGPSFLYASLLIGYEKYLFLKLFVTIFHLS